ncbi:MAG: hypothetical protein MUC71_08090 [Steroidobacteraceae bacterium]|jgi:hypothetical protein|nr:hypothetical protein [Steroidobacteraceae bacterium]
MKIPKDGPVDTTAPAGGEVPAANDDAIEGGGKPAGWDPFEVWRTRVRDARPRVSGPADEPPQS